MPILKLLIRTRVGVVALGGCGLTRRKGLFPRVPFEGHQKLMEAQGFLGNRYIVAVLTFDLALVRLKVELAQRADRDQRVGLGQLGLMKKDVNQPMSNILDGAGECPSAAARF